MDADTGTHPLNNSRSSATTQPLTQLGPMKYFVNWAINNCCWETHNLQVYPGYFLGAQ